MCLYYPTQNGLRLNFQCSRNMEPYHTPYRVSHICFSTKPVPFMWERTCALSVSSPLSPGFLSVVGCWEELWDDGICFIPQRTANHKIRKLIKNSIIPESSPPPPFPGDHQLTKSLRSLGSRFPCGQFTCSLIDSQIVQVARIHTSLGRASGCEGLALSENQASAHDTRLFSVPAEVSGSLNSA